MDPFLAWLQSLPPAALYLALGVAAAAENIFPPLPTDTVVAFGTFLAARGRGGLVEIFLATWIGNVAGAMAMYLAGRKVGAERLMVRFRLSGADAESRLSAMYGRYGVLALAASRFIPGVRALVPPFAGALHIPALRATAAMALASGVWYGIITWLAYRVGADWEGLVARLTAWRHVLLVVGTGLAAVLCAAWLLLRRRAAAQPPPTPRGP